jgi:hypothetical protein
MTRFEKILIQLDESPWEAIWRGLGGAGIIAVWVRVFSGRSPDWSMIPFVLFMLLLLRVVPMLVRSVVSFSIEAREVWAKRRDLAKRCDSYQWRKLFWIGLGMALYIVCCGEWRPIPLVLTAVCLVSGVLGVLVWNKERVRRDSVLTRPST